MVRLKNVIENDNGSNGENSPMLIENDNGLNVAVIENDNEPLSKTITGKTENGFYPVYAILGME